MLEWYAVIKALHIAFFTSWFAGLFYLPRLFVNLAMVDDDKTYQHLLVMAKKLYRFITPLMVITLILGLWMLHLNSGLLKAGWMHLKLGLVSLLIAYHFVCGFYLKQLSGKNSSKSHVFFRWFNELPVVILFAVVILAVTKSF